MKQLIIFLDVNAPKASQTYRYFRGDSISNDELLYQLGVMTKILTPIINKDYSFSVRTQGKRYKGYITTQGDFVVRFRNARYPNLK